MPVSSHEVSMPSTSGSSLASPPRSSSLVPSHHQRVGIAGLVVTPPYADHFEAISAVQQLCRTIVRRHFQQRVASPWRATAEQLLQQPAPDPRALLVPADRDVVDPRLGRSSPPARRSRAPRAGLCGSRLRDSLALVPGRSVPRGRGYGTRWRSFLAARRGDRGDVVVVVGKLIPEHGRGPLFPPNKSASMTRPARYATSAAAPARTGPRSRDHRLRRARLRRHRAGAGTAG